MTECVLLSLLSASACGFAGARLEEFTPMWKSPALGNMTGAFLSLVRQLLFLSIIFCTQTLQEMNFKYNFGIAASSRYENPTSSCANDCDCRSTRICNQTTSTCQGEFDNCIDAESTWVNMKDDYVCHENSGVFGFDNLQFEDFTFDMCADQCTSTDRCASFEYHYEGGCILSLTPIHKILSSFHSGNSPGWLWCHIPPYAVAQKRCTTTDNKLYYQSWVEDCGESLFDIKCEDIRQYSKSSVTIKCLQCDGNDRCLSRHFYDSQWTTYYIHKKVGSFDGHTGVVKYEDSDVQKPVIHWLPLNCRWCPKVGPPAPTTPAPVIVAPVIETPEPEDQTDTEEPQVEVTTPAPVPPPSTPPVEEESGVLNQVLYALIAVGGLILIGIIGQLIIRKQRSDREKAAEYYRNQAQDENPRRPKPMRVGQSYATG